MTERPGIPADLKRRLMIEAGHRCAIPTCRAVAPLQIDHIEDWAKARRHDFENMIVLCANCHGRKGDGHGQIDRKALRQYKANLAVINSRYSDLERRVLEHLAEVINFLRPFHAAFGIEMDCGLVSVPVPGSMRLLMKYLLRDGYVELVPGGERLFNPSAPVGSKWVKVEAETVPHGVLPTTDHYRLTPLGLEFLDAWTGARPLDGLTDVE